MLLVPSSDYYFNNLSGSYLRVKWNVSRYTPIASFTGLLLPRQSNYLTFYYSCVIPLHFLIVAGLLLATLVAIFIFNVVFFFCLFCFGFVFFKQGLVTIFKLNVFFCFVSLWFFFFNRDYGKGSSEKLFSSTVSSQAVDSAGSSKVSSKQETVTTTASVVTASPAPKLTIKSEPLERTVVSQTLSTTFVHVSKLVFQNTV